MNRKTGALARGRNQLPTISSPTARRQRFNPRRGVSSSLVAASVLLLLAGSLAACSSSSKSGSSSPTTAANSATTAANSATTAANTGTTGSGSAMTTLTVAVIDPLSGPLSVYGKNALNGAKAGAEYLNAGNAQAKNVHYVIESRDSQATPTVDNALARELTQSGIRF